ncbi:unnamed protein product [Durusdinium trenchii]|uniref:Uncharacterized protein n=1 Tax=Durusdinium trenchii TaxID=1381693 RepID=A0ABP0J8Y4_9DINO
MVGTLPAGQPTSRGTAEPSVARRRVGPDFGTSSLKLEDRSGQGRAPQSRVVRPAPIEAGPGPLAKSRCG